jgi:hypothetical protein
MNDNHMTTFSPLGPVSPDSGGTDAIYTNPAYGHHVGGGGESFTDEDDASTCDLPRTAWLSGANRRNGNGGAAVVTRTQSHRSWLRDGGLIVALVVAVTALGLSAAREGICDSRCAAEVEAASSLLTMTTLNAMSMCVLYRNESLERHDSHEARTGGS